MPEATVERSPALLRPGLAALLMAATFVTPASAAAAAADRLARFFSEVETFSARFEQVILDERSNPIEESAGELWIARPGRFRWDYRPPLEQHIVSDGERVWFYDVELEQVTVRPLGEALGRTPAILLAGEGDVDASYVVTELGEHDRLAWVALAPRDDDAHFETIRIGFEGDALRVLELIDGLGQTTRITLSETRENPAVAASRFELEVPADVDVIDETQ